MIGGLLVSVLITSAMIAGVALFVRWAIREGEGDDPRWGLTGQLDAASPLIGFAERRHEGTKTLKGVHEGTNFTKARRPRRAFRAGQARRLVP